MMTFLSNVTSDGPKQKNLEFNFGENKLDFKWGDNKDFGDGRLLLLIHHGVLKLFNAKKSQYHIDLEDYRIKYVPPPPPTEEEMEEKKQKKKEAFEKAAKDMTEKLNNVKKLEIVEEFTL